MRWPVAMIAIVAVALLSSAATVGAERLITGADIKDGSITGADIKRGSLKAEHLESKARHTVYRSKPQRSTKQSTTIINAGQTLNVASAVLPAGDYIIMAQASIWSGSTSSDVSCGITDSAKQLTKLYLQAWPPPLSGGYQAVIPLTTVTTASYAQSVTIYLTCSATFAQTQVYYPGIVAEQVSLAPIT